jgi:FMN phosphatase YigB (HAD superfamily)
MGKIFIFDIDDTIIIHTPEYNDYYTPDKNNKTLLELINTLDSEANYAYTNGTYEHGDSVMKALNLKHTIKKIFARDTVPHMKPLLESFQYVHNEIIKENHQLMNEYYFFDDLIENLKSSKKVGWKTVWISPNYAQYKNYMDIIDYAFPNIYQALMYFNKKMYY